MNSPRKPSVLFVFYTHTEQSRRVADAMASVLRERGCDVSLAGIEFTDPRYAAEVRPVPFRHAVLDLLAVLPAQVRRSTGQIRSLLSLISEQAGGRPRHRPHHTR